MVYGLQKFSDLKKLRDLESYQFLNENIAEKVKNTAKI